MKKSKLRAINHLVQGEASLRSTCLSISQQGQLDLSTTLHLLLQASFPEIHAPHNLV
jgi:hypothetical protein